MKWNSRKFAYGLLLLAIGVCIELLSPRGLTDVFAGFLAVVGATYFAGNVGEHYMNSKKKEGADSVSADSMYDGLISEAIAELNTKVESMAASGDASKEQYLKYLDGILKSQNYIIKAAGLGEKK